MTFASRPTTDLRRGRFAVSTVALVMLACGGSTTGTTGSGGPTSSGGESGSGGYGGAPECTKGSDCGYPIICITCPDGIDSCPTGANCINGQCVTTYTHECNGGSTGVGGSGGVSIGGSGGTGGTRARGGTLGAGGLGTGGSGGVSPGKVSIEFTVVGPDAYCMTSQCGSGPRIDIKDSLGHSLFSATPSCLSISCERCTPVPCPALPPCPPPGAFAITGASLEWDGSYYATSTCGTGTACTGPVYAKPARYTAEMCATPGKLTGPDGGIQQQCVNTGPAKCGSIEFDFPSSTVVKGTVGP